MVELVNFQPISKDFTANPNLNFTIQGPLDNILSTQAESPSQQEQLQAPQSQESPRFAWMSSGSEPKYEYSRAPVTQQVIQYPSQPTSQNQVPDRSQVVQYALSKVGRPYVWGSKGKNDTFDCSGLIYAAYKAAGISVPGSTKGWLSSSKQTVGAAEGQPGDVIITGSKNSPSGRHARLITKNLGNGKYECVEAKGKKYGVITSTYTANKDLLNIYRAKYGLKLIKKKQK